MHRSAKWYEQQAEKGRRELDKLFAESAARRRPALRLYPNLTNDSRDVVSRPAQAMAKPSAAAVIYSHLPSESK